MFYYKVRVGLAKAGPFLFGYLKCWSYIYSIIKNTHKMGQKQTATQWLAEQMNTAKWKFADVTDRNAIIQQALQMEKEQIITSHHDGYNDGCLKNNAQSAKYYYDNY